MSRKQDFQQLVTVFTSAYEDRVGLAKSMLMSADIEFLVLNDNLQGIGPTWVDGIQIQVFAADEKDARALLGDL